MKVLFLTLLSFICLHIHAQEDSVQTVWHYPSLFYEINKYPTIIDLANAAQENKTKPKLLKKGEKYIVSGLPEDERFWGLYVKVKRYSDGKEGWLSSQYLENRECLLKFFPNFRNEYKPYIKKKALAPGMNKYEVFVCTNAYIPEKHGESDYIFNKNYRYWGTEPEILLFYNGELCANAAVKNSYFYYRPELDFFIDSVHVNNNDIKNKQIDENKYSDDIIDISWSPKQHCINFELINKTSSSIKILWDDMAFINSRSHRVIHREVKFIDKDKEQANTVVGPQSKITDSIIPSDGIEFTAILNKWTGGYFYNHSVYSPKDTDGLEKMKQQKFSSIFTIKHKDKIYEYIFYFSIKNINMNIVDDRIGNYIYL